MLFPDFDGFLKAFEDILRVAVIRNQKQGLDMVKANRLQVPRELAEFAVGTWLIAV